MNRSDTFDDVDKAILAEIEAQFPVEHRPFQALGQKLGLSEQECLSRIDRLKATHVIRQISAIFDARALGYRTTVVAMQIEPARTQEAVRLITQHPGVSHSYALNDRFNLWFIIHVPPADSLEQV
ncbi:MAG: Lrp/AsnC family transcriptional regulator, partial [Candidatus Omnitrophica bacterium]|nr:Lrp/AsnC family transcriptional regulator [Candidatus Omnitrophota bacterium]